MLCLSGFELYSRWLPLVHDPFPCDPSGNDCFTYDQECLQGTW